MNDIDNNIQPKRKSPRLKGFDYGKDGVYFLTFCTQDRKKILSDVVGEGAALPFVSQNMLPELRLSYCGRIADKWINRIPDRFPGVFVDCYVIMPNHIHILLRIVKNLSDGREDPSPTETAGISTNSVMGWIKYNITKEINSGSGKAAKIFRRSYHDHITRDRNDYYRVFKYITENPVCWQTEMFYVE